MTDDALARLRKSQKPAVPARDASLDSLPARFVPDNLQPAASKRLPKPDSFETKQSTVRLETNLCDRLQAHCRKHKLSREVFIEALYLMYEAHPELQQVVIDTAKQRGKQRLALANKRRLDTNMKRYGEGE